MPKLIALVGMCGAGKSIAADFFVKNGFQFLRFGQITLDEVIKRGLEPNEENEKKIREEFRHIHGMGAFATLNLPKIDVLLKNGNVVIDGLYSWSEYKILKQTHPQITVVAIYASPKTRYARLTARKTSTDMKLRDRQMTMEKAAARDFAEIENIEKGGPIAMADYTVNNDNNLKQTIKELRKLLKII